MPFDEFKWRTMTSVIKKLPKKHRLLQDMIFRDATPSPTDTIDVDVIIGGNKILPFVSPIEGGTIVEKMGREVQTVKVPRVRPKKPFNASELLTERSAGAVFYPGAGNIQTARRQRLAEELADLDNYIGLTKEWMCAQALTGVLTVAQDNIAFAINYKLPAANKPTASPLWSGTDPDIIGDIEAWCDIAIDAGHSPSIAIMGKNVWSAIRKDSAVMSVLDNRRVEAGGLEYDATVAYKGNLNGLALYRYGGTYTPWGGGAAQKLINDNAFIIIDPSARFTIEYGAIMDLEAEARVVGKYFSKSWTEKDPSALWILAESRPLPVPWQPEAIIYATATS